MVQKDYRLLDVNFVLDRLGREKEINVKLDAYHVLELFVEKL